MLARRRTLELAFLRWARLAAELRCARSAERLRARNQKLAAQKRSGRHCLLLWLETKDGAWVSTVVTEWRKVVQDGGRRSRGAIALGRLLESRLRRDGSRYYFSAWRRQVEHLIRETLLAQRLKAKVVLGHLSKQSNMLGQRALLAWHAVTTRRSRANPFGGPHHRCFLAWWLHILQQRSPEQKEMLELIESSNGWIQRLQRERWAYEERLAAADGQIRALEEALDAEEKSKEALMLHLEHRSSPMRFGTREPVAVPR